MMHKNRLLALALLNAACQESLTGAQRPAPADKSTLLAAEPVGHLERSRLDVEIFGLRKPRGSVAVAVFDQDAGFPDQDKAVRRQWLRVSEQHAQVSFDDLVEGVYAIAVLHDENDNQRMDYNFLGIPTEGFGFSNDAKVGFGPPDFEEAAIVVKGAATMARIQARYF